MLLHIEQHTCPAIYMSSKKATLFTIHRHDQQHTVTIGYKGIGYKGKSLKWEGFGAPLYYVLYREKIA
jgi:hypothetical protein